jgi:Glycosyl transferase family 2
MRKYLVVFLNFVGLKLIVGNIIETIKFKKKKLYHSFFNKTVISQNKNYKEIPIIIISFNQLQYLKRLIDFLKNFNYNNIVIIDNNSTYEPLLEYFNEIESVVKIHRLKQNYGHLVFWKVKELFEKYSKGYYVVTDADINPVVECPEDFLLKFKYILDNDFKFNKVGFSLKIDDIPLTNLNRDKIIKWESRFWDKKTSEGNFIAKIDTTFALYKPSYKYDIDNFMMAIRTKYPIQAIHGGWYIDNKNLSKEQDFYYKSCDFSSSWLTDNEGNLVNKYYKENL